MGLLFIASFMNSASRQRTCSEQGALFRSILILRYISGISSDKVKSLYSLRDNSLGKNFWLYFSKNLSDDILIIHDDLEK